MPSGEISKRVARCVSYVGNLIRYIEHIVATEMRLARAMTMKMKIKFALVTCWELRNGLISGKVGNMNEICDK